MGLGIVFQSISVSKEPLLDNEYALIRGTEDWCNHLLQDWYRCTYPSNSAPDAYVKHKQKLDALIFNCYLKVQLLTAQGIPIGSLHEKLEGMRNSITYSMTSTFLGGSAGETEKKIEEMRAKLVCLHLDPLKEPQEKKPLFKKKSRDDGMSSSSTFVDEPSSSGKIPEEISHCNRFVGHPDDLLYTCLEDDELAPGPTTKRDREHLQETLDALRKIYVVGNPDSEKDVATTTSTKSAAAQPSKLVGSDFVHQLIAIQNATKDAKVVCETLPERGDRDRCKKDVETLAGESLWLERDYAFFAKYGGIDLSEKTNEVIRQIYDVASKSRARAEERELGFPTSQMRISSEDSHAITRADEASSSEDESKWSSFIEKYFGHPENVSIWP